MKRARHSTGGRPLWTCFCHSARGTTLRIRTTRGTTLSISTTSSTNLPRRFRNPSIPERLTPDGLPLAHYAANQRAFYRNSVVSLDDMTEKAATMLIGDCNGNFVPVGYPFNWRDVMLGIGRSPEGFGCPARKITTLLMADGSVRLLNDQIDLAVVQSLAGQGMREPRPDQVAKPTEPYRLKIRDYWRYLNIVRAHKSLMTFNLSPDRTFLAVDFRRYDSPADAEPEVWRSYFKEFQGTAPIETIEVKGHLRARELLPFLEIPSLKRLTLIGAHIDDDKDAVLSGARKDIVVD